MNKAFFILMSLSTLPLYSSELVRNDNPPSLNFDTIEDILEQACINIGSKQNVDMDPSLFKDPELTTPAPKTKRSRRKASSQDRPFICSICFNPFKHQGNLTVHLRSHTSKKRFSCGDCHKGFTRKNALAEHKANNCTRLFVKPIQSKDAYQCLLCARIFEQITSVNNHIDTHRGKKLFECSICRMICRIRNQMKEHIRSEHG